MNIDACTYNITVRLGEFEGEMLYEARVKELPDLTEYGESFEEAYDLAVDAIETTSDVMAEKGRAMPAPLVPVADYSGRVTLRLPKRLHRNLAETADSEGVSLNQMLVAMLSYYSGFAAGQHHEGMPLWRTADVHLSKRDDRQTRLRLVHSCKMGLEQQAGYR